MSRPRSLLKALVTWFAIALAVPAPATAATPSLGDLQQHDTIVNVTYTQPLYHLDVYGLIQASPDEVWQAITCYDHYDQFLPLVTKSRLRKRDGNVAYQYVRMNPPWPFHVQWMVNANQENKATGSLNFSEASGN
ncbi:MAG TPA: SRPBCC family protein, partial [Oscillatoriaceae cyanobacterium]